MEAAPIPNDDAERLDVLSSYEILDSEPEESFDDLTRLAAHIVGVPISLVSLVDRDRQWFKSCVGLGAKETPRDVSFCGHAVASGQVLHVPDAHLDERFADNPLVTGAPFVRFYLGIPLTSRSGHILGTLCVIDQKPRVIDEQRLSLLEGLARQTMGQIELRRELRQRDALLAKKREMEEHKNAFISLVNHELRTPLTSILGSLKLLHAGVAGDVPPRARELLVVAERNALRLARLITNTLDLDRIQAGALALDLRVVDLPELAHQAVENNAPFAQDEQVELVVHVAADVVGKVQADRERLLRVLDNLISNAIKYSPPEATVTVAIRKADGALRVDVSDLGPGVAEEARERIFERFSQAAPSPHSQKSGSGLGLAIAAAIVDLHGGELTYAPNEPTGSRFSFSMPTK